ncbi:phage tail fiber protein [Escherichia coli]|nr:phage tail fiber protein [Escherichia coli]
MAQVINEMDVPSHSFVFYGTGERYFLICVVNVLLTIITLGIYLPWALMKCKRYLYANMEVGFAPIFPDICYHLTHYKPAAADIPVASDNPAHYADAIRYNARTPLQGSLLPLTRLVWA